MSISLHLMHCETVALLQKGKWSIAGACQICFLRSVTTTGGEHQCWVGGTGNGVLTLGLSGILLSTHQGNSTSLWALLLHHLARAECWSRSRSNTRLTAGVSIPTTCSPEYEQAASANLPTTQVHTKKSTSPNTKPNSSSVCNCPALHNHCCCVRILTWLLLLNQNERGSEAACWALTQGSSPLGILHFWKLIKEIHLLFGSN